jgi:S1-C subfamily serine protease
MPANYATRDLTAHEIFRIVEPSVYLVRIGRTAEEIDRGEGFLGSTVAVSEDTALTNCHVIEGQAVIRVVAGQKQLAATVALADRSSDRCFLKVEGKLVPISAVRRVQDLKVGERVYTIGNPSGLSRH